MNHVTPEHVRWAYRLFLDREPESDEVLKRDVKGTAELREHFMGSNEFQKKIRGRDDNVIFKGFQHTEIALLERYHRRSQPAPGYIIDFVGSRTDVNFNTHIQHLSGHVEGLPVPGNFHAEAIEWIGTMKAVDTASETFAVAELGAGWGPWLVSSALAAKHKGINDVSLVGVEADDQHFACLRSHLANNQFNPDAHLLLNGVIGPNDGYAFFPLINADRDWGAAAVFSDKSDIDNSTDFRGRQYKYVRKRAYSVETALKGRPMFDLVHVDIQGSEREVIPTALPVLNDKVRWLVIGTHSRSIEGLLFNKLSQAGWKLENEKPCQFDVGTAEPITEKHTRVDGAQVWRNMHHA